MAAESDEVHIQNVRDWWSFPGLLRGRLVRGKTVYLDADIDLSGTGVPAIPYSAAPFYGRATPFPIFHTGTGTTGLSSARKGRRVVQD
jgi:hypothetical protein